MHENRTSTINALASHVLAGHRIPTLATPTTHEEQLSVESWYTAYFRQQYHRPKRAYIILTRGEAMSQRKEEIRGSVQFCTYHSPSPFHKIPSAAVIYHDNTNQHQTSSHVDRKLQRYPEAPIHCIQLPDSFLFITFPLYVLPPKVLQPHPLHPISEA